MFFLRLLLLVPLAAAKGEHAARKVGSPSPPPAPSRRNRTSFSGIWVQHGQVADLVDQDFVLGGDIDADWGELEVGDGIWDWSAYDKVVTQAAEAGFFVETALQVGPASPTWMYDRKGGNKSVTKVKIIPAEGHHNQPAYFPYYLDPTYQELFLRALDTFAEHLFTLPEAVRARVVAVQAEYGSTGDDCPWHGTPADPKYDISDEQWHNFTMSTAPRVCDIYTRRSLHVLWNTNSTRLSQLVRECPGSFIKAGMVSHSFQVNFEADNYEGKGKICHTRGYHCRGESWPFCQRGYYLAAPLWATYSHLLWQLTFGVDMPGLSEPNLLNASYAPYYRDVFNRYASSIPREEASTDPEAAGAGAGAGGVVTDETRGWVGGIVALRDGLDSADTVRFPEAKYGTADISNEKRLLAIANDPALKARGAVVGDPVAAASNADKSRQRNKPNDVGWRIWSGNYGNQMITQLAPDATSVGWWHVGPKDQPYGRFARGFEAKSGRTQISFVLDKRLWGGLPLPPALSTALAPAVLKLRIIYLEQEHAGFEVAYDSHAGCRTVQTVTGGTSGRWVVIDLDVTDGRFSRSCAANTTAHDAAAGGADIVLRASKGADAIVHGVEIYDPARALPE